MLVVLVTLIWGLVIYRVYNSARPHKQLANDAKTKGQAIADTFDFVLHSYTRDPFLSILTDTVTEPEPVAPKPVEQHVPDKRPYMAPRYCGQLITNNQKTAILKRNNKFFFVMEGQSFEDVKIRSITADSLVITDGAEKIVIAKSGSNQKNAEGRK